MQKNTTEANDETKKQQSNTSKVAMLNVLGIK